MATMKKQVMDVCKVESTKVAPQQPDGCASHPNPALRLLDVLCIPKTFTPEKYAPLGVLVKALSLTEDGVVEVAERVHTPYFVILLRRDGLDRIVGAYLTDNADLVREYSQLAEHRSEDEAATGRKYTDVAKRMCAAPALACDD